MLFRDQVVYVATIPGFTEDEDEWNGYGYKAFNGASEIKGLTLFRHAVSQTVNIGLQDLVPYDHAFWAKIMQSVILGLRIVGVYQTDEKFQISVKLYTVSIDKNTGVATETESSTTTFADVTRGKFGNYLPPSKNSTGSLVGGKFTKGGTYFLGANSLDCVTIYGPGSVVFKKKDGTVIVTRTFTTGYNVCAMDVGRHNALFSVHMSYKVEVTAGSLTYYFNIDKSKKSDGSNSKIQGGSTSGGGSSSDTPDKICDNQLISVGNPDTSGTGTTSNTNSVYYGNVYDNLWFEHPNGGIDNAGTVNYTGGSGSSNRGSFQLQENLWKTSGYNPFQDLASFASGGIQKSYQYFSETISESWMAQIASSKRAYLVINDASGVRVIQGEISGVSYSYNEYEDGYKAWTIEISFNQTVNQLS
jgi:hypothetical protein